MRYVLPRSREAVSEKRPAGSRILEMPLCDIRSILAQRDRASVRKALDVYRTRIEERIADYRRLLLSLQELIDGRDEPKLYDIRVKEALAARVLTVTLRGPLDSLGAQIGETFVRLYSHLLRAQVAPTGPALAMYLEETWRDPLTLALEIPIVEAPPLEPDMTLQELAASTVAATVHVGDYDTIRGAHDALRVWIPEHGYEQAGPCREVFIVCPAQTLNPREYRTEVLWPVRRRP
jgi:effector-binding domain-containing protein